MSDPYVGEIRMFGGNFAPVGWALCNGQIVPIDGLEALFTLIGTTYGGDGVTNFGLPDLQGRLPVHQGGGLALGTPGGTETVTLDATQLPAHSHQYLASASQAGQRDPTGNVPAAVVTGSLYVQGPATAAMAPQSLGTSTGGGQPHDNMQPYQCVTFIISLYGVFPPHS